MAHRPVGLATSFATSSTSSQSSSFSVRTKALRVTAVGATVQVSIGTDPVATSEDYVVLAGTSETLAMTVAAQRVSGITTGATTVIDFPEGTTSPFNVGDFVSLTSVGQPYYNLTHVPVLSVDNSSSYNGYFSSRITIGANTSGIATAFSTDGELRKSLKVAAKAVSGSGTLYAQQVQISGDA